MHKHLPTLAIYGIQDRFDYEHPFYVHDHNLAIMQDGCVQYFLQQERTSRRKRDNTFHLHLKDILKEKKLLGKDFNLVFVDNVVGRTFLHHNGEVRFEAPLNGSLSNDLEEGKCWWFGKETKAWVINHELAHIFSSLPFFGNLKENSLLVHFDGGASLSNFSAADYINGKINWLEYHWDLKTYSTIYNANALVFSILGAKLPEQNAVPGKFMGFAGLGKANPEIEEWLVNNNFFQDIWGKTSTFLQKAQDDWKVDLRSFDQKNEFVQNVAASLQNLFVKKLLEKLTELQQNTQAENLYYTGGSALNIVANTQIVESNLFKNVFIPPCTEDSGLALGAAAFVEWKLHGAIQAHTPYLNNWGIETYNHSFDAASIKDTADLLLSNKLVGICNAYGEAGPRALGNRSILALANSKTLSKKLSMEIKGREWYRPLAPIALEKNTRYFTGKKNIHELSRYMLLDYAVLAKYQNEIAGACHADGTARFQTIFERSDNPFMFELLQHLDEKHGIKALINTSFNAGGEPIVHTEEDAKRSAKNMGLDALVLNGQFHLI